MTDTDEPKAFEMIESAWLGVAIFAYSELHMKRLEDTQALQRRIGIDGFRRWCAGNGILFENADKRHIRRWREYLRERNCSNASILLWSKAVNDFFIWAIGHGLGRRILPMAGVRTFLSRYRSKIVEEVES